MLSKLILRSVLILITLAFQACSGKASPKPEAVKIKNAPWHRAVYNLSKIGVPEDTIWDLINDPRFPPYTPIPFSLSPKESHVIYKGFLEAKRISEARTLYRKHLPIFQKAEEKYGVDGSIIASILFIESQFGANTGNHLVVYRFMRLAEIGSEENIKFNLKRLRLDDPRVKESEVRKRAKLLEENFTPEIKSLLEYARENKIDPLTLKGSIAGAFGIPQFIPSSALNLSVDGDGDGKRSLFNLTDSIFSTANFLRAHGWRSGLDLASRRQVIWHYNKSEAYISAVIKLAASLQQKRG